MEVSGLDGDDDEIGALEAGGALSGERRRCYLGGRRAAELEGARCELADGVRCSHAPMVSAGAAYGMKLPRLRPVARPLTVISPVRPPKPPL